MSEVRVQVEATDEGTVMIKVPAGQEKVWVKRVKEALELLELAELEDAGLVERDHGFQGFIVDENDLNQAAIAALADFDSEVVQSMISRWFGKSSDDPPRPGAYTTVIDARMTERSSDALWGFRRADLS